MKKKLNRILAVFLSVLCMLTIIPANVSAVLLDDAAIVTTASVGGGGVQSKINELQRLFPTGSYFTTNGKPSSGSGASECYTKNVYAKNPKIKNLNLGWKKIHGAWSCCAFAHFAFRYTFGSEFTWSDSVSSKSTSDISNSGMNSFFAQCKVGDAIKWNYKGGGNHYMIFLGYTKDKKILVYDCNIKGECKVTYNHSLSYSYMKKRVSSMTRYTAKNYDKVNGITPSISSTKVTGTTNTTGTIRVDLNQTFAIEKWAYYLGTSKNEVANINGTSAANHKSTVTMDCKRAADWSGAPKSRKTDSITLDKFRGEALKPNTTYYYKALVCIGGKWYQSAVTPFTTTNVLPGSPVIRVAEESKVIGIGDQATLLWDQATGAETYNITVIDAEGNEIQKQTAVTGSTCVLNAFEKDGTYTASVEAVNGAGVTKGGSVEIVVMPNLNVTFVDTIDSKEIAVISVPYGHAANPPKNPVQDGHTFSKWDRAFDNVTEDITVNALYDKNSYTVKFIDSFTNEVIKSQTVKYQSDAVAPQVEVPAGYELTSWDKPFNCVTSDLNVYTVYSWKDKQHPVTVDAVAASRITAEGSDVDIEQGYEIKIDVTNRIEEITSGRAVVVLRSAKGVMLTATESSAFALDKGETKSLYVNVLYPDFAYNVEVYVVNSYESLGMLSVPVSAEVDNGGEWSGWINYEGECPVEASETLDVETQTIPGDPEKYIYRYNIKETTTSTATSLSGFMQDGYTLEKASTKTIDYVASWPSGFYTGNALYKTYNKKPVSASESATQKVVVDSTKNLSYIYWHWCRNDTSLERPYNRGIGYSKTSKYHTFHAFNSTTNSTTQPSSDNQAYKFSDSSKCPDTYWWGKIPVKRQTYTTYNKIYNYYKLSDYTDWMEYDGVTLPVAEGDSVGENKVINAIGIDVIPATPEIKQYRYKNKGEPIETETPEEQLREVQGTVDEKFVGKDATVWIYKFDQASDYTVEYVGPAVVGEGGTITIDQAILREIPSVRSGDYTIVASVDGQDKAIEIGKIEAPKAEYTVTFYDFDGTAIDVKTVKEGDTAALPDESLLHVPEGSRFTNWSESVVNVKSDMSVYPESITETYTVAVVNWEVQTVELKKFTYGAELIIGNEPEGKDGFITEWVVKNENDEYITVNEFTEAGGVVKSDMIVVTRSTPRKHNVTILDADKEITIENKLENGTSVDELETVVSDVVVNGEYIDFSAVEEAIEEAEEIFFIGWIDAQTGEPLDSTQVAESVTIYPAYVFSETVEPVYADIETGEYTEAQTVTLTSDTPDSVIWYTTDGTDPKTSETAKEYTAPVTVSESCTMRYYATALGMNDSETEFTTYAINTAGQPVYHIVTIVMPELAGADISFTNPIWLVKDGASLPVDIIQVIEGYEVGQLFFDPEFTEEFLFDAEVIGESISLYAKYVPKNYTVTFTDSEGNVLSEQTVPFATAATAPEAAVLDGYVFTGWDSDFSSITGDITIKAQYIPESEYASIKFTRKKGKITLNPGTCYPTIKITEITPSVHSDYEIQWSSDNEAVATVDENGMITAVDEGTAIITATLPYTGAFAELTVRVTPNDELTLVLSDDAVIGMDSERNIREVTAGRNTVAEILGQFENEGLVVENKDGEKLSATDLVTTGCTVCLYNDTVLLDSAKTVVTGDFNCDGVFDNKDIVMANQFVIEQREAGDYQMLAIDVNGDGAVNNRDCAVLLRLSAGLE